VFGEGFEYFRSVVDSFELEDFQLVKAIEQIDKSDYTQVSLG